MRVIVPGGVGGGDDFHARLITQRFAERFGQPFVVDNRPGAGGLRAQLAVVKAAPDGHTILLTGRSITTAKALTANLPFEPQRDLVPISSIASYSFVLTVSPRFGPRSVQEYLAHARKHPGGVRHADSGRGLMLYTAAMLFRGMAGVDLYAVTYKEFPQLIADLLAARIDSSFLPVQSVQPHLADGRLRALGVTGSSRSPVLPEVPTIAEAGLPGYEASSWLFFAAPAGTSPAIVATLNDATARALAMPDVQAALRKAGSEPLASSAAELARRIADATSEFARVASSLGIRPQ